MPTHEHSRWSMTMIRAPVRKKPWLAAAFLGFIAVGVVLGWFVFPPAWGAPLRIGAGVALGVGATLSLFLPRLIATDFDE